MPYIAIVGPEAEIYNITEIDHETITELTKGKKMTSEKKIIGRYKSGNIEVDLKIIIETHMKIGMRTIIKIRIKTGIKT